MTNNNTANNANMKTPEFILTKVNPKDLQIHPILSGMGFANRPDEFFNAERLNLGCKFECPIVDTQNNVLTHSADVIAAQEQGTISMEVYVVELDDIQKRRLIAHKHYYNKQNLTASYETSIFFKSYMTENPEGMLFASTLPGKTTRQKVAGLLNTGDSTIKRLWFVGDNLPEEFGLINENNSSLKQAEEKIKLMKWKKEQAEILKTPMPAVTDCTPSAPDNTGVANQLPADDENVSFEPNSNPQPKPTSPQINSNTKAITNGKDDEDGDSENDPNELSQVECTNSTSSSYSFSKSSIEIAGMGQFSVNVTENVAEVVVNGKAIEGITYLPLVDLNPLKFGNVNSFVFQENRHKGLNIQIIISNFPRKA